MGIDDIKLVMKKKNKMVGTELIDRNKNYRYYFVLLLLVLFILISLNLVFAQFTGSNSFNSDNYQVYGSSVNPQFSQPSSFSGGSFGNFGGSGGSFGGSFGGGFSGGNINREQCLDRHDFVLFIPPGGCSPNVVTSDLLEEQNVPVYCKVTGLNINPLLGDSRVRSIRFQGKNPDGISGVSYYPSRAGLGRNALLNDPENSDLGYLVVVLSRNPVEDELPDSVNATITAVIDYQSEGAFGVSDGNFYLSEISEEDWQAEYREFGFWNGRGFIRADSIESEGASIGIYRDVGDRIRSVRLRKGETSGEIFLNQNICGGGMRVKLEDITAPVETALLQINDQQVWVGKGDRIIDERCRVTRVDTSGSGGRVSISCPVKDGRIELKLSPGGATIDSLNYAVGDRISGENIYLAYVGQYQNRKFSVVIQDEFSDNEREFRNKDLSDLIGNELGKSRDFESFKTNLKKKIVSQYSRKLSASKDEIDLRIDVKVIEGGEEALGVSLDDIEISEDAIYTNLNENEEIALNYYERSIDAYEDLIDLYPFENREFLGEDPFAAWGLFEAAELSKQFGFNERAREYYGRLKQEYPDSLSARKAVDNDLFIRKYNTEEARASVIIQNELFFIDLLDIKKPSKKDASAVVLIDGKEQSIGLGDIVILEFGNLQFSKITDDTITLEYDSFEGKSKTQRLRIDDQTVFESEIIKLLDINLKEQAKVKLLAGISETRSTANLSVEIGIEKRAIDITPERAKKAIKSIKESIETWESLNKKLGTVIKVMKGACFATSTFLTVSSFFDGLNGESIARNFIMRGDGGWNQKCEDLVDKGTYRTTHQCLLDKNKEINTDVEIYGGQIKRTNDELLGIQERHTKEGGLFGQNTIDSEKVNEEYKRVFDKFCKGNGDSKIKLPDKRESTIKLNDMCEWKDMTLEQRRNVITLERARMGGSDVLRGALDKELGKVALEAKNHQDFINSQEEIDRIGDLNKLGIDILNPAGDPITYGDIKVIASSDSEHKVYGQFNNENKNIYTIGDNVVRIKIPAKEGDFEASEEVANKEVIVKLKSEDGKYFVPNDRADIVTAEGDILSDVAKAEVHEYMRLKKMTRIKELSDNALENPIKGSTQLKVKFFEKSPYRGLPSEVPFDIENGWYAEMTYVLSGFGQPYDDSGRVVNFYVCNVGENGKIEFKKSGDDICRYYNAQTGAAINFPGLSVSESSRLVGRAQNAINQAAKQFGKDRITINGQNFESGTSFGGEEGQCTDFMSPADCNLLFNVCDPVICPPSRCDLGGSYRVDNVIQTGVIGSLLLCLPNAQEGIAVPICLTGVHAGLEGYISILNSTAQCLEESIETGRTVGICDEIQSIYLCEFFWKQAGPFVELAIPSLFQGLTGQGSHGGGEYLTVQNAWESTQGAIGFFKNNYAVNSFEAFNARSTEGIGTEICKSFTGVSVPGGAEFFENLIEPDSPPQYHAWFSEDQLQTATVPPTSHYKVYYHIFAGNDIGASYSVYLKDPADSGRIVTNRFHSVARGYVPKETQVDEARDFIATSGYKQLCVSVNGKEECGFGKVSTSFLVNSISDSFAEDQLRQDISTEKGCVAGTPSLSSLFNPNLQAGIEEATNPEIYNQGIIRVCSTDNPGKQVEPDGSLDKTKTTFDRWKDVGYCGDKNLRCWLDSNSVKEVVRNKGLEDELLNEVDISNLGGIEVLSEKETRDILTSVEKEISRLSVIGKNKDEIEFLVGQIELRLHRVANLGRTNVDKANALYLIAKTSKIVAEQLWITERAKENKPESPTPPDKEDEVVDVSDDGTDIDDDSDDVLVNIGVEDGGGVIILYDEIYYNYFKELESWTISLDRKLWYGNVDEFEKLNPDIKDIIEEKGYDHVPMVLEQGFRDGLRRIGAAAFKRERPIRIILLNVDGEKDSKTGLTKTGIEKSYINREVLRKFGQDGNNVIEEILNLEAEQSKNFI